MEHCTTQELQEALRPIASLISKSEKAQRKLRPGTWQHRMLQENLEALHLAAALMARRAGCIPSGPAGGVQAADVPGAGSPEDARAFGREDLQKALTALSSMTRKAEEAQARFAPGTPQHSLQRNRIRALRLAEALTLAEVEARDEQP